AFAELEALPCSGHAVLLALLGARVAREKPFFLQPGAQLRVELAARARDAETDRAGLTGDAAAVDRAEHVELVGRFGQQQRLLDLDAQRFGREVVAELAMVDGDGARAGPQEDARG